MTPCDAELLASSEVGRSHDPGDRRVGDIDHANAELTCRVHVASDNDNIPRVRRTHRVNARNDPGRRGIADVDYPKYAEMEKFLMGSGPATIEAAVQEKVKAEETALRCIETLDRSKDLFEEDKFRQLRRYFENAVKHARQGQHWERMYFALRWCRNSRSAEAKEELENAIQAGHEFVETLRKEDGDLQRLPKFIREVEETLAELG